MFKVTRLQALPLLQLTFLNPHPLRRQLTQERGCLSRALRGTLPCSTTCCPSKSNASRNFPSLCLPSMQEPNQAPLMVISVGQSTSLPFKGFFLSQLFSINTSSQPLPLTPSTALNFRLSISLSRFISPPPPGLWPPLLYTGLRGEHPLPYRDG